MCLPSLLATVSRSYVVGKHGRAKAGRGCAEVCQTCQLIFIKVVDTGRV